MGCHALQHVPFPAVVFHELRGQFDGIPFDAVDAGHAQFLAARQQVVQAVAGFVEQGDHFVMREGGRQGLPSRWPTGRAKLQFR